MKDFFISYNKNDKTWAEWIAWQLEDADYQVVIQAWDFLPGHNFILKMQDATKDTERTIAVLSQNYLDAVYTYPEWAAAIAKDPQGTAGALIPVVVGKCEPDGLLGPIIHIDLLGLDEQEAKQALLTYVKQGRAKPKVAPVFPGSHTISVKPPFPPPAAPEEPSKANGDLDLEAYGIIDCLADIHESSQKLTALLSEYRGKTESLNIKITQAAGKIERVKLLPPKMIDPTSVRKLFREPADDLKKYGSFLADFNKEYGSSWDTFESGLLQLVKDNRIPKDNQDSTLLALKQMKEQMVSARAAFELMANSLDTVKGFQKDLNRAAIFVQREIRFFIGIIEKSVATMDVILK